MWLGGAMATSVWKQGRGLASQNKSPVVLLIIAQWALVSSFTGLTILFFIVYQLSSYSLKIYPQSKYLDNVAEYLI